MNAKLTEPLPRKNVQSSSAALTVPNKVFHLVFQTVTRAVTKWSVTATFAYLDYTMSGVTFPSKIYPKLKEKQKEER